MLAAVSSTVSGPLSPEKVEQLTKMSFAEAIIAKSIETSGIIALKDLIPPGTAIDYTMRYSMDPGVSQNQGQTELCWVDASLKLVEIIYKQHTGVEEEFSRIFFSVLDKIERANTIFLAVLGSNSKKETPSKDIRNLMSSLLQEGGQWEFWVNLVLKYGLVPAAAMPETNDSMNSTYLMKAYSKLVSQAAGVLQQKKNEGCSEKDLQAYLDVSLHAVTHLLVNLLGTPPTTFSFNGKEYTPQGLFAEIKEKCQLNLEQMVNITDFSKEVGVHIQIPQVRNVTEGSPLNAIIVKTEDIFTAMRASIEANRPVFVSIALMSMVPAENLFSLDADGSYKIMDAELPETLDKQNAMYWGAASFDHAITLIGCNDDGKTECPDYDGRLWKASNSWAKFPIVYLTDAWIRKYLYAAAVDWDLIKGTYPNPPMKTVKMTNPYNL